MDYFNGITNDDFKAYFLKDLNCLDELTQFIYPNEMMEDNNVIDEHIMRCQSILGDYIINVLSENDKITVEKINELYEMKNKQLNLLFQPEMEFFYKKVKVKIINLG